VMLIPNTHLETPNYSVLRIRHDEANQMDLTEASYQLVEVPEEAAELKLQPEAQRPVKPVAAVRGITPQQPAPVAAPAPEQPASHVYQAGDRKSLLGTILGWFKGKPTPAPEAPAARPAAPAPSRERGGEGRGERRRGRGGRERDRERERDERSERPARGEAREGAAEPSERSARSEGGRQAQTPKPQRQPRESRREREEVVPAAETAATLTASAPAAEQAEAPAAREGGGRRRGRRGGRRERGGRRFNGAIAPIFDRGDGEMPAAQAETRTEKAPASETGQRQPRPRRKGTIETFGGAPVLGEQVGVKQQQAELALVAPAQATAAPAPAPVAAAAAIPLPTPPAQPTAVSAPATSLADIALEVPAESGLVLVQTRREALAPAVAEQPQEPAAPRRRRARNVPQSSSAEPLVQVETHKPTA
ncbi:MAG: hypothetical protein KGJ15_06275, partial [Betaproteobacteria bacterium]|nr:hypothetical protein [Betaproteobacteria bacterium]